MRLPLADERRHVTVQPNRLAKARGGPHFRRSRLHLRQGLLGQWQQPRLRPQFQTAEIILPEFGDASAHNPGQGLVGENAFARGPISRHPHRRGGDHLLVQIQGFGQLLLRPFPLGNVAAHPHDRGHCALFAKQRHQADVNPLIARREGERHFPAHGLARGEHPGHKLAMALCHFGRKELRLGEPDEGLRLALPQGRRRGVDVLHPAVPVENEDGIRRCLRQRPVALFAGAHGRLRPPALRNVLQHTVNPLHLSIGAPVGGRIDRTVDGCAVLLLQSQFVVTQGSLAREVGQKLLPLGRVLVKVRHVGFLELLHRIVTVHAGQRRVGAEKLPPCVRAYCGKRPR